jgi:glycosyltransferase involved in cell wall biosynthesis
MRLLLWLVSTGAESEAYLEMLHRRHVRDRWIEIDGVDYGDLSTALRQATCLVIPNPPQIYHDVGLPVKLFDSMAAGRPLVVTPRRETRALVERHGAGLVTAGDHPDDLAQSLRALLTDEPLARRLGAAARLAAEQNYHWPIVGDRLATVILEREGTVAA